MYEHEWASELLQRLGEVAIPELGRLSRAGNERAVNDLTAIGTPAVTEVLVELLWHNEPSVAGRAAQGLAELLRFPEVQTAVSEIHVAGRAQDWNWVWEPFRTSGDENLAALAGRTVSQLQIAEIRSGKFDPRIACATLVARSSQDMQERQYPALKALPLLQQKFALETAAQTGHIQDDDDLVGTRGLLPELMASVDPAPPSKRLLLGIPEKIAVCYLAGVIQSRIPQINDWRQMMRPSSSRWRNAYFLLVTFLTSICSAGTVFGVWREMHSFWMTGVVALVLCAIPLTMIFLYDSEDWFELYFSMLNPHEYAKMPSEWIETVRDKTSIGEKIVTVPIFTLIQLAMVVWIPLNLWWNWKVLSQVIRPGATIIVLAALAGLIVFLLRTGKRLSPTKENPLLILGREFQQVYKRAAEGREPLMAKATSAGA